MKSKKTKRFAWFKKFMEWSRNSPSGAIARARQTPMKPILEHKSYHCPICRTWIMWDDAIPNETDNYCGRCGQKIDWAETE